MLPEAHFLETLYDSHRSGPARRQTAVKAPVTFRPAVAAVLTVVIVAFMAEWPLPLMCPVGVEHRLVVMASLSSC